MPALTSTMDGRSRFSVATTSAAIPNTSFLNSFVATLRVLQSHVFMPASQASATVENSIYVAPAAQGTGLGGRLLEALMADCTNRGFRQMIAVIGDGTGASVGSRRLHEKAGLEVTRLVYEKRLTA